MKQRSQRGAARVSAVWIIVSVVAVLVSLAFAWISQTDLAKARSSEEAARQAEADAVARFDAEAQKNIDLSEMLGFYDRSATAATDADAAKAGLAQLREAFPQLDDTVVDFEQAVPIVIGQYNASLREVETLKAQNKEFETQLNTVRQQISTVSSQKDSEIRDLQQQLSDAENAAADEKNALEQRIASLTSDRNEKDSQLRAARGTIEDKDQELENEKQAALTRIRLLSDTLAFTKEPERPDGSVLAISKELGVGWIDLGSKHRLSRGTVFHVVSGKPNSDGKVKAWVEVTNVENDRAEIRITKLADQFDPVVPGDIVYNPLFDPAGRRNAVLAGRFSGQYNEKEIRLLLADIGIFVQKNLDLNTDYLIVGSEIYVDENDEPVEEPIQPSELPVYRDAVAKGVQIVSLRDVARYFRK